MNTSKCPICGKQGIPDYLNEDVICPNCNSDLKVYRALHSLAKENDNAIAKESDKSSGLIHRYQMLSIVLPILAVLLVGVLAYVFYNNKLNNYSQELTTANNTIENLRDSISTLTIQNEKSPETETQPNSHFYEYTVVPNDSPWRIINKFYGNCEDQKSISRKIAEANGIWNEGKGSWETIHPGQTIKIYNIK